MTKKRKRYPDLNQKLERPWCYYCERDFDDLKILISHQKAKHFKCDRCGRRLNTAGGLSVHMNQVHKETLTHVENATAGRQNLDIEIFGMEGVPPEIIEQHNQAVTEKHFAEQAERQRLTGNPVQGTGANGEEGVKSKRPRVHETVEEIEAKAESWRQDRRNGVARPVKSEIVPVPTPPAAAAPAAHFAPPGAAAVPPFAPNGAPGFPPPVGLPGVPPPFAPPGQFGAPPPGLAPLPTRPTSNPPPAADLSNQIDNLIAEAAAPEKKEKKKGKDIKLVFYDENVSPEEKMAALPRYGEFMRA